MTKSKASKLRTKEKQVDFILVVTVLVMLALGIVMVLSASSPSALAEGDSYSYVKTQSFSAVLGLILMYMISKVDYKIYKKFDKIAYFASICLLLAVLIPGLGVESGGATRWLSIGSSFTFQPSEIVKVLLVIFYASYLTKNRDKIGNFWDGFIKPIIIILPILAILIGVQSHLSASILIVLVIAIMMIMAGSRLRYFLTFGSIGVIRRRRTSIHTCNKIWNRYL